jgi:anthranilate/para-aminobenzoate synthase component I
MTAIRRYEAEPRGYFMGSIFAWDFATGRIDSSILIRTVQRVGVKNYEYAAGSGIVLASDPAAERDEVYLKCGVLRS